MKETKTLNCAVASMKKRTAAVAAVGLTTLLSRPAFAQAIEVDTAAMNDFGCAIYSLLTGTMAIWSFILVAVCILVVGLLLKIDFSRLFVVVIIFLVIQGLGALLMKIPSVAAKLGGASCLVS